MHVIRTRNVHTALPLGLRYLNEVGQPMPSRAGDVIVAPSPVTTIYEYPCERVIFYPERDANPFFHVFEALWMLAGRNDLKFLTRFVKRFSDYSDDGKTLAGAYGYRWRRHWGFDQVERVITHLKAQPLSRRAVIAMWDPARDLQEDESASHDIPCNDLIMFRNLYGRPNEPNRLHMTVVCRSHDIIWGAYGANAVHFSFLQEYVAARLGLMVGTMTTVSNNYHAYADVYARTRRGALLDPAPSPYEAAAVAPMPIINVPDAWDRDLLLFLEDPRAYGYANDWFSRVAKPLWFSHAAFKAGNLQGAFEILEQCRATDWQRAAREWLERRKK